MADTNPPFGWLFNRNRQPDPPEVQRAWNEYILGRGTLKEVFDVKQTSRAENSKS